MVVLKKKGVQIMNMTDRAQQLISQLDELGCPNTACLVEVLDTQEDISLAIFAKKQIPKQILQAIESADKTLTFFLQGIFASSIVIGSFSKQQKPIDSIEQMVKGPMESLRFLEEHAAIKLAGYISRGISSLGDDNECVLVLTIQ